MRTSRQLIVCLVAGALVCAALFVGPAADAADAADGAAIRGIIEHQIEAFRHDDGPTAYAFASPALQQQFGAQERFMDVVKRLYAPVYRPRIFTFGEMRDTATGLDQAVRIQDESGVDWDAVYSLEKAPDGSWRISGCRLVKAPGESV